MAELALAERRDLIAHFVDKAKINWAHIAIGQLMKHGYVDRVLTTNFDLLVVRACAMLCHHPAVYDFASSQVLKPADLIKGFQMNDKFPDIIQNLPDVDIAVEGVRGKLLQSQDMQVVFFDIDPVGEIAPHSHAAQWGVVLEGEMDLTIGEETKTYRPGDSYYIPAGVLHGATFHTHFRALDLFAEPQRYKAKA